MRKGAGGDCKKSPPNLLEMINNNHLVPGLYAALAGEENRRENFRAVLQNHILEHTQSVVMAAETSVYGLVISFYCPLLPGEYGRLAAANYTPILRSKLRLTADVGFAADICYACVSARFSQDSGMSGLTGALALLARELELLLDSGESDR